jgi:hypothetical protein
VDDNKRYAELIAKGIVIGIELHKHFAKHLALTGTEQENKKIN